MDRAWGQLLGIGMRVADHDRRHYAVMRRLEAYYRHRRNRRNPRVVWVRHIYTPQFREEHGQFYTIVPYWRQHKVDEFRDFFKMDPDLFDEILQRIRPQITRQTTWYRKPLPPDLKLAITLRLLASGNTYRELSYNFLVSESSMSLFVPVVLEAFIRAYKDEVMTLPRTAADWLAIEEGFRKRWNFPHAIGALDGRHVPIFKPGNGGSLYYNYKGFNSIVLMGMVDADYKFIWFDVGGKGCEGDAQIWNVSGLKRALKNRRTVLPVASPLPHDDHPIPYFILADDAFALETYLMKPYSRSRMEHALRVFNYRLSRGRRVVENAFGIMYQKLQIMMKPLRKDVRTNRLIVKAACFLHNLLRMRYPVNAVEMLDSSSDSDVGLVPGSWRRRRGLPDIPVPDLTRGSSYDKANSIRQYLTEYFNSEAGSIQWQDDALQVPDY